MPNPFTAHPRDVGETYSQHAAFALRYGVKMTLGGFAAIAHAFFPFLFQKTASRITDELAALLAGARARTGKERERQ